MRYTIIRELDISNGEGVGISLFVQGCHFQCHNCFNPETWDFDSGNAWTKEVKISFINLLNRPYIKRVSILGGEPLAEENLTNILDLVSEIRDLFPNKNIWLYTGYTWKEIMLEHSLERSLESNIRADVVKQCDVLVDGRYVDSLRDITLHWRGSSNQRVIDVKETLKKGEIVLWRD